VRAPRAEGIIQSSLDGYLPWFVSPRSYLHIYVCVSECVCERERVCVYALRPLLAQLVVLLLLRLL